MENVDVQWLSLRSSLYLLAATLAAAAASVTITFGFGCRWTRDNEWEACSQSTDFGWMQMAEPVMKLYTEATDGSYMETKESALVWHHHDADPGFGSAQAKEMLDHLESVLANEPVLVKSGQFIVEVKPQVSMDSPLLLCQSSIAQVAETP